ncbi:hypothetical protein ABI59_02110 [Acidobacteria bacterium Mor1]|nr:hypothetical protein ABI59_02110 [Acidobacteria bacterium Mor1]
MIRKETLDNGLLLLTESIPHVRSVTIGVWLKQGSRHEPPAVNGISHFLEHLVFKGTDRRSAHEIALAADRVGMQLDAFTTKEYTCFYAKVLDEHLEECVDLLADIVQHPRFDPVELERERQVVLEEIRMVEDSPEELVYDLFSEAFYAGHALGRPIQGTEQTVGAMSRRRLQRFFRDSYCPDRMLIVAAGSLKHGRVARMLREGFGGMKSRNVGTRRTRPPKAKSGIVKRSKKELEQLHLLLGMPAFAETHDDRYALFVMNTLLGGTMSSRLFQKIREERGLVYSVYSGINAFSDSGFLMVSAATSPEKGREVLDLTLDELRDLRDRGATEEEVDVAKRNLKSSLMLSLESTSSRMSNLARQEIYYGRQHTLRDVLRRIDKVDAARVHKVTRKLCDGARPGLAAVGKLGRFRLRESELAL